MNRSRSMRQTDSGSFSSEMIRSPLGGPRHRVVSPKATRSEGQATTGDGEASRGRVFQMGIE